MGYRGRFLGDKGELVDPNSMGYGGLWVATGMGYNRFDCMCNLMYSTQLGIAKDSLLL